MVAGHEWLTSRAAPMMKCVAHRRERQHFSKNQYENNRPGG